MVRAFVGATGGLAATLALALMIHTLLRSPPATSTVAESPEPSIRVTRAPPPKPPMVVKRSLRTLPMHPTAVRPVPPPLPRAATDQVQPSAIDRYALDPTVLSDLAPGFNVKSPKAVNLLGRPLLAGSLSVATPDSELSPLVPVKPYYPVGALHRHQEGWVLLAYRVTPRGTVKDIRVLKASPPKVFEESAIDAASKWRYRPRIVNGEAVAVPNVWSKVTFSLSGVPGGFR